MTSLETAQNDKPQMGGRIRRLRRQQGMSQAALASELGISASYLNLIEHNRRNLTVPILIKLAERFELELSEIADNDEGRLNADLMEAFGDELFGDLDLTNADVRDLVTSNATVARAILALYDGYRNLRNDAEVTPASAGADEPRPTDRLPSEQVSDFLQARANYFPELDPAHYGFGNENLDEPFVDLSAVIYYAIIETASHWFIYYLDFHPRDWTEDCDPLLWFVEPCHENDLEGAMVVIRKNGTNFGVFEVLYTEAHNTLHVATNDPNITAASTPNLEDVPVTFEGGSHVELYVESKGHGVCPLYYDGDSHCEHPTEGNPPAFPGGDGIVYRYDDGVAEQPSSGSDPNVSYKLVSFYDTMWKRRYDVCDGDCTYDQLMTYGGAQLGETFDGDTWGADKARPPWSWDDPDDGPVYSGDWFFDPAKTLVTHLSVPGEVSFDYVHNPYLDELWPAGGP